MKLRILSCAIFSCMLAACGGGSDSSDNNEPVTSQPAPTNPGTPGDGASDTISEFYNYQFNLPNIDGSEMESQKLLLASHKNKITHGILYADNNSAVDTEYDLEEDMVFSTYVTTKGVFPADRTRTALGYKLEKILENTTTQFKSRPVTIPENNISNHRHIAWYDLSGKALTERTNIAVVKMYDDPATRVLCSLTVIIRQLSVNTIMSLQPILSICRRPANSQMALNVSVFWLNILKKNILNLIRK